MDRRDFLKTAGATLGTLVFVHPNIAGQNGDEDILAGADARIEKHRKARAALRLTGPDGKPLAGSIDVRIEQTRHKFLFGCNIFKLNRCRTEADSDAYAERFSELLNFATLPFYWWNYERNQGNPDDARTDEIVKWCKAHNVTTKGHPLAWNYVQPPWLAKDDPEKAMRLQLERIGRCAGRFKGDIDIWDVVNEATHYDRPFCKENAPALTKAIADMGLGEYLRQAFEAARKANPAATLLINDYRTDPAYEKTVISELEDSQGKAMYDVIGIQSHMHGGYWGAGKTWNVCETFARYGVPLHFTETTVISGPKTGGKFEKTTPDGEATQARAVAEFYTLLFSHPSVEAITWWDFSDQNAWQGAPAGLVREDMSPKPAYDRLMELVKGKWWTKAERQTRDGGRVRLNGFLGDYSVRARVNGAELAGQFTLDKGADGPIEVKLG